MDKLTGIRVFCAVARDGSFSRAAREMALSPAMVSKHIKRLEDELGVRLLNRSTRRSKLTEAGTEYFTRCEQILAQLEETELDVKSLSGEIRGTLKISAPSTFGTLYLIPVIVAFKKLYPKIQINLHLSPRMPDLLEGGFDLAIHAGSTQLTDSSLIARRLGSFRMIVCASAAYLKMRGIPEHPEDLTRHNCLVYQSETARDDWIFHRAGSEITVRVSGDLHCNTGNALRMAAREDLGIVRLPSYLLEADLRRGTLQEILPDFHSPPRAVFALYPHRRHVPAKVRGFLDLLSERFRAETQFGDGSATPS